MRVTAWLAAGPNDVEIRSPEKTSPEVERRCLICPVHAGACVGHSPELLYAIAIFVLMFHGTVDFATLR